MSSDTDPLRRLFELRGHDCPLGQYPSLVVPVGTLNADLVAVYSLQRNPEFHPVRADARFQRHDSLTAGTLKGFSPFKHGLFALGATEIVVYNIGEEKAFYSRLLRYSPAFYIEPFYRFSLAIETDDVQLMRRSYISCARHMRRDAPDALKSWITAADYLSPSIARAGSEWLRSLDASARRPPSAAVSATLEVAALPRPESRTPAVAHVSEAMGEVSISRALRELGLPDVQIKAPRPDAYDTATRISLGVRDSTGTQDRVVLTDPQTLPGPMDVQQASGLSLPLLEFRNIVLSRNTAVEFLRLSASGLGSRYLLDEVLRPDVYRARFQRPEVKIKRRQVFTYAEVLALVGYASSLNFPFLL